MEQVNGLSTHELGYLARSALALLWLALAIRHLLRGEAELSGGEDGDG